MVEPRRVKDRALTSGPMKETSLQAMNTGAPGASPADERNVGGPRRPDCGLWGGFHAAALLLRFRARYSTRRAAANGQDERDGAIVDKLRGHVRRTDRSRR
jgi:hypothetical protein